MQLKVTLRLNFLLNCSLVLLLCFVALLQSIRHCLVLLAGKGIPNALSQVNMAAHVTPDNFPPSVTAVDDYERDLGSALTREAVFGRDPFQRQSDRQACEVQFCRDTPQLSVLFSRATHGDYRPLQDAVLRLVDLTCHYSQ